MEGHSHLVSPDSLPALPQPYDISTAVSRVLRIDSYHGTYPCGQTGGGFDPEAACPENDHTTTFVMTFHGDNFPTNTPPLPPRPSFSAPRHTSDSVYYESLLRRSLPPPDYYPLPSKQMEVAPWISSADEVGSSSVEDVINTDPNAEQLDDFCRYINSGEEEDLDVQFPSPTPPDPAVFSPSPRRRYYSAAASNYQYCSYREPCEAPYATLSGDFCDVRVQPPRKKRRSLVYYEAESPDVSPIKDTVQFSPDHSSERLHSWEVQLHNAELWREFDRIGTEMVITKNGRRMFPALSILVKNLDPETLYSIHLDILPADDKRYKFLQTDWVPVGRADKKQVHCRYMHPDSPNAGSFWMEKPVTFKLVKLTNNKGTKYDDQVILNSMQKYQPCFLVTSDTDKAAQSYFFPESQFIAVTAYQNSRITQLKIDHNPYARAFREGIPAEDNATPTRKGGHFIKKERKSPSPPLDSPKRKSVKRSASSSSPLASPPSLPYETPQEICTSATSMESGFESGDGSNERLYITAPPSTFPETQLNNPYEGCQLNYWADENSLYNPALITPPPLLDSTSSFSESYLQQSSRMMLASTECIVSPVKGLFGEDLNHTILVPEDTDDVFL